MSRPRLIETMKFGGCRDRDSSRLKNLEDVETETHQDSSKGVETKTETESVTTHCLGVVKTSLSDRPWPLTWLWLLLLLILELLMQLLLLLLLILGGWKVVAWGWSGMQRHFRIKSKYS